MEKKSNQKVKSFFKKNIYYIIMAVCLLAIATMITVTVLTGENNSGVNSDIQITPDDPISTEPIEDNPVVTEPVDDNPVVTEPVDETPTVDPTPIQEDPVVKPEPIVFSAPVETVDVIKDYSMDALVWNSTLRHYAVHNGIDFGGTDGTNVLCVCDGVVSQVGYDILNGYTVTVQHNDTLYTSYGSMSEPTVQVGQKVKKGEILGTMGNTAGNEYSMGPHLHFSVYEGGKNISPYQYMTIGGK